MIEIDIWFGDGDCNPIGPIKGLLIEESPNSYSKIQITDKKWLDNCGIDWDYFYECKHLPTDHFVSYDDYAWCYPGECSIKSDWWND